MNPMYAQPFPGAPMMNPNFNLANKMTLAPALYVGDLDENIQEESLYDFFSKFGSIHFVRIMRDSSTGKSRGYAFVNFIHPRDAESAKEYAQYEKLGRKHIRIMFKRNIREIPSDANVYVKEIDPNVNVKELHQFFKQVGTVVSAKIATDSEGNSLGYGYVQFDKPEDAKNALEQLQGKELKEKQLQLQEFKPKDKRATTAAKKNIYVKNLPTNKTETELNDWVEEQFNKYGNIERKLVKKHPTDNKFSAFVCYQNEEDAQKAFNALQGADKVYEGNTEPMYVNWHQGKSERQRELKRQHQEVTNQTNLFLKNLKETVTEDEIKTAFKQYGPITSVAVKDWQANSGSKKAKFAFVAFNNADDAKTAISEGRQNQDIRGLYLSNESPYINLHQPKEKRSEYLQSQRRKRAQQFGPMMGGPNPYQNRGGVPMDFQQQNRRFQAPMGMNQPFGNKGFMPGQHYQGGARGQQGGAGGFNKPHHQQRPDYRQAGHRGGRGQAGPHHQGNRPQNRNYNQRGGMQGQGNRNQYQNQHHHKNQQQQHQQAPAQGQQAQAQGQQAQPQAQAAGGNQITVQSLRNKLSEFLQLDQDKQRQILGELLYPLVKNHTSEENAPKITGMLIDLTVLEVSEILDFLEDPDALKERVQEAEELIQESG